MDIRDRILTAARRVYALHGFRGATTRLIAIEAGVNEVSLFRTFGSKAALFQELTRAFAAEASAVSLPDAPRDPERELTDWVAATLTQMRDARSLLRKSIAEVEERPDTAVSVCEGPTCAGQMLREYVGRLRALGIADPGADYATAAAMLMSTMFGDAMCREIIPDAFPQPVDEAPAKYVRAFLRSIGVAAASPRATHRARVRPAIPGPRSAH